MFPCRSLSVHSLPCPASIVSPRPPVPGSRPPSPPRPRRRNSAGTPSPPAVPRHDVDRHPPVGALPGRLVDKSGAPGLIDPIEGLGEESAGSQKLIGPDTQSSPPYEASRPGPHRIGDEVVADVDKAPSRSSGGLPSPQSVHRAKPAIARPVSGLRRRPSSPAWPGSCAFGPE